MSQKQQFANFAAGTLAAPITSGATSITLGSGQGANFPALSGAQFFIGTLKNVGSGYLEIVKVTARSTDTLTVIRGQEGTVAAAFSTSDVFELRVTAQTPVNIYTESAQLDGAAFTGVVSFAAATTAPTVTGTDNSTNVATTAFVKGQAYATLANPALTGVPTAPTATVGTNTTQVATTAFVTAATATTVEPIQTVTQSYAANALTATLGATTLNFRSTTLTSGTITPVTIGSPISVVVPSGATLGTISGIESRIVILAINNAGTAELAVVNLAGGNDLTESGVISTTAISAGSTSASVIYSTTARTNVAYRVVGYIDSTQATAGTWVSTGNIQGYGGQALAAMSSLGYGQTYQSFARVSGTTYYNVTGRPIALMATNSQTASNGQSVQISVGGTPVINTIFALSSQQINMPHFVIVPPNTSYVITAVSTSLANTVELR
jgi:hypothetical protein